MEKVPKFDVPAFVVGALIFGFLTFIIISLLVAKFVRFEIDSTILWLIFLVPSLIVGFFTGYKMGAKKFNK